LELSCAIRIHFVVNDVVVFVVVVVGSLWWMFEKRKNDKIKNKIKKKEERSHNGIK
jgi:hypothetical protein